MRITEKNNDILGISICDDEFEEDCEPELSDCASCYVEPKEAHGEQLVFLEQTLWQTEDTDKIGIYMTPHCAIHAAGALVQIANQILRKQGLPQYKLILKKEKP